MMRTGVSRPESAVKDGALYKEKTYVDGKLSLKARVKKESVRKMKSGSSEFCC